MKSQRTEELNKCKIAFVGWNPFQFVQVKPLAKAFPGAVFVVEIKPNNIKEFDDEFLKGSDIPVLLWERKNMKQLDGLFDVIVAQTQFMHIHMIKNAKLVFLQYGYAKEPHNYGTWRALADLCLAYGDYAAKKMEVFSPTIATGNPRYKVVDNLNSRNKIISKFEGFKDTTKPTLLYMPTWGGLSSVDNYFDEVLKLADDYNLFIKLHHNTYILEKDRIKSARGKKITCFGLHDDGLELILASDLVISDYSGAIFDVLYCKKKIVLLDLDTRDLENESKIDTNSLEFSRRDDIGLCIRDPQKLRNGIEQSFKDDHIVDEDLRSNLFIENQDYVANCVEAILDLLAGKHQRTQMQTYIYQTMIDHFTIKRDLAIAKKTQK